MHSAKSLCIREWDNQPPNLRPALNPWGSANFTLMPLLKTGYTPASDWFYESSEPRRNRASCSLTSYGSNESVRFRTFSYENPSPYFTDR